jgi:hypothetical protein
MSTHNCRAKTKAGKPCKAVAVNGDFCAFHADPQRAAELGRMGVVGKTVGTLRLTRPALCARLKRRERSRIFSRKHWPVSMPVD